MKFSNFENIKNNIYYQSKKIIIKFSCPEMGLGVFATEDIDKDEMIERCPLIKLGWRIRYHGDPQIRKYCFPSNCACSDCQKDSPFAFLSLGYGMLYNHQDENNCRTNFDYKNLICDYVAIKPIKKDDEIFINYGNFYFTDREKHIVQKENGI
jgi:SET domain-containing protein